MTISINSDGTGGTTTGADGTFSVTKPGTVSDGDILFLIVGMQTIPTGMVSPGWQLVGTGSSASGNDTYLAVFSRFVPTAGSEPASYTFYCDQFSQQVGWYVASLSTTDQAIYLDQAIGFANRQNDTSPNTNELTTVAANTLAFAAWAVNNDNNTDPPGAPWTTEADNVGGNGVLTVSSQAIAGAGTGTGTPEITNVAANQETETAMIVLRDNVTTKVQVTHAGAYLETRRQAVQVTHAGAYLEIQSKRIQVGHAGAYLEIYEIPAGGGARTTVIVY